MLSPPRGSWIWGGWLRAAGAEESAKRGSPAQQYRNGMIYRKCSLYISRFCDCSCQGWTFTYLYGIIISNSKRQCHYSHRCLYVHTRLYGNGRMGVYIQWNHWVKVQCLCVKSRRRRKRNRCVSPRRLTQIIIDDANARAICPGVFLYLAFCFLPDN